MLKSSVTEQFSFGQSIAKIQRSQNRARKLFKKCDIIRGRSFGISYNFDLEPAQ